MGFIDAEYRNDSTKSRPTTGITFTFSVGAVVYRSKTQPTNAMSSTDADIIDDLNDTKTDRLFSYMLW